MPSLISTYAAIRALRAEADEQAEMGHQRLAQRLTDIADYLDIEVLAPLGEASDARRSM